MPGFLLLEALLHEERVDLIAGKVRQVDPLDFLAVLVEEDEVRVMMRNEVDLEPHIGVSMARILDESPSLRELIQPSS